MIGLALQFLSGGFTRALSWATANTRNMLIVALVAVAAWGWLGHHNAAKWKRVLASTEQAYRNAQADAAKAKAARDKRQVATNTAVNKGSTDANAKGLDAARTAVAAYARMHPAPRCAASQASPAAVPANPGMDAENGGGSDMVTVTVADLDTLAAGTVRAESCRAWAAALISAGLAEGD